MSVYTVECTRTSSLAVVPLNVRFACSALVWPFGARGWELSYLETLDTIPILPTAFARPINE